MDDLGAYAQDWEGEPEEEPAEEQPCLSESYVLVAVMNSRRDWELVLTEGWYRVPASRRWFPFGADYLAFYHTGAFEEERWSVRHYAPITAVRVVRRRELLPAEAEHPRAEQFYYRFDLGPLLQRSPPLLSRRLRRVAFIRTTLSRLQSAGDVAELWLQEPLRDRLWVELNRHGIHAVREAPAAYGPAFRVPCREGGVAITCGESASGSGCREPVAQPAYGVAEETGWGRLCFEDGDAATSLQPCVESVWREIRRHGGQAWEPD